MKFLWKKNFHPIVSNYFFLKFLLKDQGMTINGVKKFLNGDMSLELDELANNSIKADNFRNKLAKISKMVKKLKELK